VTANPRHGGYPIHPPGAVQPSLRYIFLAVIFSGRFAAVGEVVSGDHLLTLIAGEFSCVLYDKYIILCSVGMARNRVGLVIKVHISRIMNLERKK
jgi:hypothetical protein